jgi:hypothetical protein
MGAMASCVVEVVMQEPDAPIPRFWDGGVVDRDWDQMELTALQPYWLTGQFPLSRLPTVAWNELERGRGGDAVLILLALDPPDTRAGVFPEAYRTDVNGLVLRALREVGVPSMTVDEAWRQVIREEAAIVIGGDALARAESADNLSWIHRETGLELLSVFRDLDYANEDYWDSEAAGGLDEARVRAAEQVLRILM